MKPYDFQWTRFYEENKDFEALYPGIEVELSDNELVICSTVVDKDNFSVLTTRKLVTKENGEVSSGDIDAMRGVSYGIFKHQREDLTFGLNRLADGTEFKYFIETRKASMVMIYGVRTRIGLGYDRAAEDQHQGV